MPLALKELRKRTGYSYVNCRKALLQYGPERLEDAEKWLRELAAKEGWTKAANLSHRQVKNGLVSVITEGHTAAVVEVNCETDFVARGTDFKNLVELITLSALLASKEYAATSSASGERFVVKSKLIGKLGENITVSKVQLIVADPGVALFGYAHPRVFDSLKSTSGDASLREALTSVIGKLGENITVSKVQLIVADPGVALFGYAHPREGTSHVDMGKFVSVVGLRRPHAGPSETLGPPVVEAEGSNKVESFDRGNSEKDENSEADEEVQTTQIDESETRLLHQSFMLNPSQTVYEYVTGHGAKIVDFFRTEIGEYANKSG
uniref:Elongation factor Ts, mitochondrial n=1 Tax=Ascaris lumbricoides TaxID=6252 RepID=A0A0M3I9F5_ASCLU